MAVVYLATHRRLGRKVALKIMSQDLSEDEDFRRRFEREASLAATLDHPNLVQVYDAGEAQGLLYVAMRYIEGVDLRKVLEDGRMDIGRSVTVIGQVAEGLEDAHSEGLIHRDVKPANILLTRRRGLEHAYLTDFGLAKRFQSESKLTRSGYYVGTIAYSAPEQLTTRQVDSRADVYSLGCVLFECVTGRVPFERDHEVAVMYAHLHDEPPDVRELRPDVPAQLADVITRAMAKDPGERYTTSGEFLHALRASGAADYAPTVTLRTGSVDVPAAAVPSVAVPAEGTAEEQPDTPPLGTPPAVPLAPQAPRRGWRRPALVGGIVVAMLAAGGLAAAMLGSEEDPQPSAVPMQASFAVACEGLRCTFEPEPPPEGATVEWDFGDGSVPQTRLRPSHRYEGEGVYVVTMRVAGPDGGTATAREDVTIVLPEADTAVALRPLAADAGRLIVRGTVSSSADECLDGAEVTVEHRDGGAWTSVGPPVVIRDGRFQATVPDAPGDYRAAVSAPPADTAVCVPATSDVVTRQAAAAPSTGDTTAPSTGTAPDTSSGGSDPAPDDGGSGGSTGGGGGGGSDPPCDEPAEQTQPPCI